MAAQCMLPIGRTTPHISMNSAGNVDHLGRHVNVFPTAAEPYGVPCLTQEAKDRRAEAPKIRKDCGEVGVPDAKPGSEGGAVLVDCHRRYPAPACPASLIGIVWASRGQRGEHGAIRARDAVAVPAVHGPAHDHMVRTPGMVRA